MGRDNEIENKDKDGVGPEHLEKKLPYPKSVFFIVSNEFCERFSYYGMRTILSIYLTDMLLFSEPDAKIIYHAFTMLVYFFPIFGAMLADSYLGKFRTIFYVSIIYAIGSVILALAATPPLNIPATEVSIVGLLLIAIGTGGIKPCVSAFGGDQFTLPQQAVQLANFFSVFYFSINLGSFISTFLTPLLRDTSCFDNDQCFTLAFGVPGILMVVSIIIFGLGKKLYKIKEPEGNLVLKVSKCIGNALKNKFKSKEKEEHWLDYAIPKYGKSLVQDVKGLLRVLVLYLPLPVFWALFDQQGTGWTFMARRMDGDIGFYTILPDQMQVTNPILILLLIPTFEKGIYPLLNRCNLLTKSLQRLVCGGILAAISFVISAIICIAIEAEAPVLPTHGTGQIILYNNLDVDMKYTYVGNNTEFIVPKMGYQMLSEEFKDNYDLELKLDYLNNEKYIFRLEEEETVGYFLNADDHFEMFHDSFAKADKNGAPLVSTLIKSKNDFKEVRYVLGEETVSFKRSGNESDQSQLNLKTPGLFQLYIDDVLVANDLEFKLGGVYTVMANKDSLDKWTFKVLAITKPNSIHMLWIVPQYVVLTLGEVMFSITGLEFSYSQAPSSMKSVLQACWLLTTAFGNLIVVIIESAEIFEEQSNNFFLYAGIMLVDMIVFALMAMRYKYVDNTEEEDLQMTDSTEPSQEGIENGSFQKGDK